MENGGLVVLAGAAAFMALSDKLTEVQQRLIIGDIEMVDYQIHLLETVIHLEMPVKNASNENLSFDGFTGHFEVRSHSISDVNILQTVALTAGQIVKIPIKITVYTTTILGEAVALWNDVLEMLRTRRFNEEAYLTGKAYSGSLDFTIKQRIF